MKYQIAVITEENKSSPKKIPKICEAYNIPCYNVTELADIEGWTILNQKERNHRNED